MNIYVGNLAYSSTDEELQTTFEVYGEVKSARIIIDRDTNRSKGFGFVEMSDETAGNAAIEALNGTEMSGRKLVVNVARPRENNNRRRF